jgi:hypothetical protein
MYLSWRPCCRRRNAEQYHRAELQPRERIQKHLEREKVRVRIQRQTGTDTAQQNRAYAPNPRKTVQSQANIFFFVAQFFGSPGSPGPNWTTSKPSREPFMLFKLRVLMAVVVETDSGCTFEGSAGESI